MRKPSTQWIETPCGKFYIKDYPKYLILEVQNVYNGTKILIKTGFKISGKQTLIKA